MVIDANDTAEMALTTIGYYRLKGYSFHLIDPATKKYIKGTTLSDVIRFLDDFCGRFQTVIEGIF